MPEIDFEAEGMLEGLEGEAREARLALLQELTDDGVPLEELKQAVAEDRLALLPVERVLRGEGERYTIEQVVEGSGVPIDLFRRQRRALGLPLPPEDEAAFTDEDIEGIKRLKAFLDAGLPEEGILQTARVIGMAMAQVAAVNRELIGAALMQPGDTERDLGLRYAQAARELGPMLAPVLRDVLNLHLREQVRQDVVGQANLASGEFAGTSEVTVCFADMVGFTKLGESLSVGELGSVAGRLGELAGEVVKPPVRLVKMIGDAAMLVSTEPESLGEAALSLAEAADAEGEAFPQLRVGVAHGPAIGRGGDFYGPPVNLASRITAVARPGSLLASEEAKEAMGGRFHYSFAGERHMKGISGQVRLFRVRREESEPT
ncbi:MAG: adenylate/guanylate cyclase domain-containing protein [Actinomycetota bacterium]|nr:adenylate/guanylate cyclase domain-containing protein [Actinomycetota bacterium]